jgi:MFS family permease
MEYRTRLFAASFTTLVVAGVGFAIRGAILADWAIQFGFTKTELGTITGGGLVGFGVVILAASAIADRVGYGKLLWVAFVLHATSAAVTIAATPVYGDGGAGSTSAYWVLYVGTFMFAVANGVCEAVINPLAATLYPKDRTHYLNVLHAGWPAGLIIGGVIAYGFATADARISHVRWEALVGLFLIPTALYGALLYRVTFPVSEARAAGVSFVGMLREFAAPILVLLLLLHAMVGYVELGTDSWIVNIMQNVIEGQAFLLFMYTSALMFVLRFFAGPIAHRINPLGLLLVSSALACVGLVMLGLSSTGFAILAAATVYGVGKTFLWPTMLGVVSERYPAGGALTLGAVGAAGMLSAGLLGGPGIGYTQDYFASQYLEERHAFIYDEYRAPTENGFLFFPRIAGLDGARVGAVLDSSPGELTAVENEYRGALLRASIHGGQAALRWTALVPLVMAIGYLFLILYFRAAGGYEAVHLEQEAGSST